MKENYFIIHGSFSDPFSNWFPWLAQKIRGKGKEVYVPDFPVGVGIQNYENWSKLLKVYFDAGLIHENTTFFAHSIAPVFVCKFLVQNKIRVKKLVFVSGFNNYFGINEEYDNVNRTMFFENLEEIKKYCDEIICFYSDNDPYVSFEAEKDFADRIATEQFVISDGGHLNSESGYEKFEEMVKYI